MSRFKLEFSEDDLSVSNEDCTKVDITDLLKSNTLAYSGGIERWGDPPRDGFMAFTLNGRDFEPLNADSPYYPNVVRRRRFFLSYLRGATYQPEFVGYLRTAQPTWPGSVLHQEVEIVCGDGTDVLANGRLPELDPPDAEDYPGVVNADGPWWYGRLGEAAGTRVVAQLRWVGRGRKRRRVRTRRNVIAAGLEGVAGAAGQYHGLPMLGRPGMIVGDPDTCVRFTGDGSASQLATVVTDENSFSSRQEFSLEAWIRPIATDATEVQQYVTGPSSATAVAFNLYAEAGASGTFHVEVQAANGTPFVLDSGLIATVNDIYYIAATLGVDRVIRLYVNGEEAATLAFTGVLPVATDNQQVTIGGSFGTAAFEIDEVAIYEHALTPERIMAHYIAGTERGFPQQTAGQRIRDAADLDLWDSEAFVQAGSFEVIPVMKTGQSPLEEIEEAVRAEGKRTIFGWRGNGDPFYLAWEWMADAPYNEPQVVLAAPAHRSLGEVHYDTEDIHLDDEVYTQTTHARIGGLAHTEMVDVPVNEEAVAEPVTELILVNDEDVMMLCHEMLVIYGESSYVLDSIELHSADEEEEDLMFDLGIGDLIRYKRYTEDENGDEVLGIDLVTHIIGFEKREGSGGIVTCTWKLARGFNAAAGQWRLGYVGFSELGETTVLA